MAYWTFRFQSRVVPSALPLELVILVAQGRPNAQIAAELHISVRTVGSHLDRIRDRTGCRRRADLTRLAPAAGLVQPGPPAPGAGGSSDPGRCHSQKGFAGPCPVHRQADQTAT
jgi:DNA-binding CsgD family transcriptional regulator